MIKNGYKPQKCITNVYSFLHGTKMLKLLLDNDIEFNFTLTDKDNEYVKKINEKGVNMNAIVAYFIENCAYYQ